MLLFAGVMYAVDVPANNTLNDVVNVLKYYRAIHVMAMLLVGFGFLMVFVRMYGRTALTATYLLVSVLSRYISCRHPAD